MVTLDGEIFYVSEGVKDYLGYSQVTPFLHFFNQLNIQRVLNCMKVPNCMKGRSLSSLPVEHCLLFVHLFNFRGA